MPKPKMTSVPVTGLFQAKDKRNLRVGTCEGEYFKAFVAKVREAVKADRGMTFFLWKNTDDEGVVRFSISADVAREYKRKSSKKIQEDDNWGESTTEEAEEEAEKDPFEDD